MPQFDFVLIYSIFFICFFYFISFFFFIYNKLPVFIFFIKYLDKILYYSYLNLIHLEKNLNLKLSFPISLFKYLSVLIISDSLVIYFFKNKRLIILDLDFQFLI